MSTSYASPVGDRRPRERAWYIQLKKTRHLLVLRDRANRLALRNRKQSGAQSDTQRVRRLHRNILRLCHQVTASDTDEAQLSSDAARAVSQHLWSLGWVLMRGVAPAVIVVLILSVLGFVLVCTLPPWRHRWFPPDLGSTARWTTSSQYPNTAQQGLGTASPKNNTGAADPPFFFHTLDQQDPYIDLEFERPVRVRRVLIENRSDCCEERALPLNVEIPGASSPRILCQRRSPFEVWTCSVKDVTTRRLRIRHPGKAMFHLRRIEVYE